MIRSLQRYISEKVLPAFRNNEANATLYINRFNTFYPLFIVYSLGWVLYELYCYHLFKQRPEELYVPMNYFSKLLIPQFPSPLYFYAIVVLSVLAGVLILFKDKSNIAYKAILCFGVLWLNTWHWSFGFASHVGHVFLLFHLLTLFIPVNKSFSSNEGLMVSSMIRIFLAGIVVIYTWSAAWKIIYIVYKLIYQPTAMTWLSEDAHLINAVSGHIIMEEDIGWKVLLFQVPVIWTILFIGIVLFMLGLPVLVLNPHLLNSIFFILILFHVTNFVITRAEFVLVPTLYLLFIVSGFTRLNAFSFVSKKSDLT